VGKKDPYKHMVGREGSIGGGEHSGMSRSLVPRRTIRGQVGRTIQFPKKIEEREGKTGKLNKKKTREMGKVR